MFPTRENSREDISFLFFTPAQLIIVIFFSIPVHYLSAQSLTDKVNPSKNLLDSFKKNNRRDSVDISVFKDSSYKQFPSIADSLFSKKDPIYRTAEPDSISPRIADSIKKIIPKPKLNTSGSIRAGYDYGVIPFAVNATYPTGYYRTEGQSNIRLFSLPVNVSYYYSDLKNISGLNNYFKISFDAEQYKEDLTKKRYEQVRQSQEKLTQLYALKQTTMQKLEYWKSQQKLFGINDYSDKLKFPHALPQATIHNPDTATILKQIPKLPDTLSGVVENFALFDLLISQEKYKDKQKSYSPTTHKTDTAKDKIRKYENDLKRYEEEIKKTNELINTYKHPEQTIGKYNPYGNKINEWIAAIKTFDVGLCYPNHSVFLINGTTLKGLNLEMEKKNYYFAFTHGKTINNLLTTNNQIQNVLQNVKNLYNFFDFNNVNDNRQITAVKFGFGKKEETHLHAGLLYGYGQTSYLKTNQALSEHEKNYVGEIDAKWVIDINNSIDIIYGKSSLQTEGAVTYSGEKGFNALVEKKERSNAALARYKSLIPKTRTRITLLGRWIDPFFKSYGVGFMRSDNFRYEIKAEQPIGNRIKVSGLYRKDEDNLLNLYYYKTTLQTLGATVAVKITKRMTVRAGYNPVLQKIRTNYNTIINTNNISNIAFTYMPKIKNVQTGFNALYSYYNLSNDSINTIFRNINFNNVTRFAISLVNSATMSWFFSNALDSMNNNTVLLNDELSYTFKNKLTASAGIKYAISKEMNNRVGYTLKANIPFVKWLRAELNFEKLIVGDFYNSYNTEQIKKFPYYSYINLIFSW